jgi:hypothetical protein
VLGDGGLGHLHAKDNLIDGMLLAVRQHGYDLGPPWFDDGAEDIRRLRGSRHEVNIFPFRNMSIKTSRNFYGD